MKRSILFGVLAMFAVSALSVQNVNAQNDDKVSSKTTQAINENKDKTQAGVDEATTKNSEKATQAINDKKDKLQPSSDESTTKNNGSNIQKDESQVPAMRDVQKSQGQKDSKLEKTGKKQNTMDRTNKKSRPKKVSKNEKMKNDTQSGVKTDNQNAQGNEGKPGIKKSTKSDVIQNNSQSSQNKENEYIPNEDPHNKNKIAKPKKVNKNAKVMDDTQSGVSSNNQNAQGNENPNDKNKKKLQKKEVPAQPNSVVRPKQKVKQGTQTQNNNASN